MIETAAGADLHGRAIDRAQADRADANPGVVAAVHIGGRRGGGAIDQSRRQRSAHGDGSGCTIGVAGNDLAGDDVAGGFKADATAIAAQALDVDIAARCQVNAAAAGDLERIGLEAEVAAAIGGTIDRSSGTNLEAVGTDVVGGAVVGGIDPACGGSQSQGGTGLQLAVAEADVTPTDTGREADRPGRDHRAGGGRADAAAGVAATDQGHTGCSSDTGRTDLAIELLIATRGQAQTAADRQVGGGVEAQVAAAAQGHVAAGVQFANGLLHGTADRFAADAQIARRSDRGVTRDVGLGDQLQVVAGVNRQAAGLQDRVAEGRKRGGCLRRQHHRAIHRHALEHRRLLVERHLLAADHRGARFDLAELQACIKDVTGIRHPLVIKSEATVTEGFGSAGPGAILGSESFLGWYFLPVATSSKYVLGVALGGTSRIIQPNATGPYQNKLLWHIIVIKPSDCLPCGYIIDWRIARRC